MGREVKAEDVAQAFVHLALARKTTAAVVTVDGGNMAARDALICRWRKLKLYEIVSQPGRAVSRITKEFNMIRLGFIRALFLASPLALFWLSLHARSTWKTLCIWI